MAYFEFVGQVELFKNCKKLFLVLATTIHQYKNRQSTMLICLNVDYLKYIAITIVLMDAHEQMMVFTSL